LSKRQCGEVAQARALFLNSHPPPRPGSLGKWQRDWLEVNHPSTVRADRVIRTLHDRDESSTCEAKPLLLPPPTFKTRVVATALIYRRTKNLRAVQLLLGHTKLESTVQYLGIEVDDALEISEQTEV
jgi:hypothetical protein